MALSTEANNGRNKTKSNGCLFKKGEEERIRSSSKGQVVSSSGTASAKRAGTPEQRNRSEKKKQSKPETTSDEAKPNEVAELTAKRWHSNNQRSKKSTKARSRRRK
jgi:hypothetical protein